MSRRSLALCLVLLVGGLGAGLAWLATRGGGGSTLVERPALVQREQADRAPAEPLEGGSPLVAAPAVAPAAPDVPAPPPDLREVIDAAPTALQTQRPAPAAAQLRLRIVDEQGAPVARYRVQLALQDRAQRMAWRKELARDVDDGDGRATLDVRSGTWRVSVHADGYIDPRNASQWTHQTVVLLSESDVELALRRACSLTGRVVDAHGLAIEGAEVRVFEAHDSSVLFEQEALGAPATSDREGRFELASLPPGQCYVTARAEGRAPCTPHHLSLEAGERAEVELVLGVGGTLHGEVLHGGRRADDVEVAVFSTDVRQLTRARTDRAGAFEIGGLASGEYQLVAEIRLPDGGEGFEFAHATVVEGERTHVVLGAQSGDAVLVRGLVLRNGLPTGGIEVVAVRENSTLFEGFAHAKVDEGGRFELELDGPGDYLFFADETFMTPVTVPAGREFALRLEITGGSIGGVVRDPSGPVAGARVGLCATSALIGIRKRTWRTTDDDGRYVFDDVPPGTYSILADGDGLGRTALDVELAPGAAIGDAHIDLAGGTRLGGQVVDTDGSPVAGVSVHVQDERGAALGEDEEVVTDGAGRFETPPLGGALVRLLARSPNGVSASVTARVAPDGPAIVLRIASGTSAVIACRDAAGKPLSASVTLRDERGFVHESMADEAAVFERGLSTSTFAFERLPPGRYTAEASAAGGRSGRAELVLAAGEERRVELVLE